MSTHYSAIVIGSGQGGGPLATAFAKAGKKTALIESTHVGGTCINEGCTPTKTMVASAKVANLTTRGPNYGVQYKKSSLTLDMETVRKRKRDIVDSFRGGSEDRLKSTENLDLIMGTAKFTGPKEIEVTMNAATNSTPQTFTADQIFINAGCSPTALECKNADKVSYLTSTSIMELDVVPKHLVVIGGGYIGVEFAQMFRRFGAKVSLVQRGPRLLPREDHDISDAMKEILTQDGIDIYLSASSNEVSNLPTGQQVLSITTSTKDIKSLVASHFLVATGRKPNTKQLNLSSANIETDERGYIKVDEKLQSTNPAVWVMGDIKGGPAFTHISYDDFRILQHNLLSSPSPPIPRTTTDRIVPYTVFTDPQLGRVGHTETSARKSLPDTNIKVAKMPMSYIARALELDETRGFMKAVIDADTKQILGFACLGVEGGEVMSMVQIAMMGGVGYDKLADGVFAHPCLSESLNNLWGFLE